MKGAMLENAASSKKAKWKQSSGSQSEESEDFTAALEKRKRQKQLDRALEETQDDKKTIRRTFEKQTVKNARALEQLAEARNNYLVLCISIQYSFKFLISLWMQTAGPLFENPVPAPELSFFAKPNPLERLKNHATTTTLTHIFSLC
jgi:hypothetical protein